LSLIPPIAPQKPPPSVRSNGGVSERKEEGDADWALALLHEFARHVVDRRGSKPSADLPRCPSGHEWRMAYRSQLRGQGVLALTAFPLIPEGNDRQAP